MALPHSTHGMEQAYRDNLLREDVVDELLAAFLRNSPLFPPVDVLLEFGIAIHIAANAGCELGMQIEIGRVLALEGDEITMEGHVIADKDAVADSELEGKAFVIRCPDPDRRATFLCHPIICVNDPEELGFLYRELLLDDTDAMRFELTF